MINDCILNYFTDTFDSETGLPASDTPYFYKVTWVKDGEEFGMENAPFAFGIYSSNLDNNETGEDKEDAKIIAKGASTLDAYLYSFGDGNGGVVADVNWYKYIKETQDAETINFIIHLPSDGSLDGYVKINVYDGDGIYDDVTIINNRETGKEKNWAHTYSSIGLVKPRVRVITLDGNFFSVQDEIIIHEKIKEASNILIDDPISITNLSMEDGTNRIFVLAGTTNDYRIEAYEVGRNETYISNRLFSISLNGFSIDNPFKIEADNSNYTQLF